jgi:hypothetical protein
MRKLAIAIVLLASTSVLAAEQWTEEEQTSGVKKVEYVRYAFAGQKMKLQLLSAMDMDCSIIEGWAFEIIKQPEHGTAEIVPTTAFPTYPKENPRHKCNEHKIDALMLTYKPNTGYKGPDSFTYVEIAPSGYAFEKTYRFNVRAIPATTTGPKQRGAVLRSSFRYLA